MGLALYLYFILAPLISLSTAGRHDGYIHGYRYFECPKDHGVFIPVKDVQTVLMSKVFDQ